MAMRCSIAHMRDLRAGRLRRSSSSAWATTVTYVSAAAIAWRRAATSSSRVADLNDDSAGLRGDAGLSD